MPTENKHSEALTPSQVQAKKLRVAIVGGGFAGSLIAARLLRETRHGALCIDLLDASGSFSRGLAYGSAARDSLLNVRAGLMSALEEEPLDFVRWAKAAGLDITPATFATRRDYGDYSRDLLRAALISSPANAGFREICASVTDLEHAAQGFRLQLSNGSRLWADMVVLALGNPPSTPPFEIDPTLREYVLSGWSLQLEHDVMNLCSVLVVGTGLTCVDAICSLESSGFQGKYYALSRRGLRPLSHSLKPVDPAKLSLPKLPSSMRALARELRRACAVQKEQGRDWREIVDSLRPVTQELWAGFSVKEKDSFLRHLRAYWDIHRHRIAPELGARLERLEMDGRLEYISGRLTRLDRSLDAQALSAQIVRRHSGASMQLSVDRAILCTGSGPLRPGNQPLLESLLSQGLAQLDSFSLGFLIEKGTLRVLDRDNRPVRNLYAIGSTMRGALWETIAVRELRSQAKMIGQAILGENYLCP